MTDATKLYRTTRPVRHDRRRYDAGMPIALPDRHAQPLLLCGAIVADEAEAAGLEGEEQNQIQPSADSADGSSGAGVVAAATAPDAVSAPDAQISSNPANANPPAGGDAADAGSHNPESESGKPEAPQASPAAPKVSGAKKLSAK